MRNLFGWSIVAALLLTGLAEAQNPRPGGTQPVRPGQAGTVQPGTVRPGTVQPGTVQPGAANQASQNNDQQIAALIAICNRHEVEIAKFAMPKLKSDKAKELATMLIKDHSEAADKFTKLAGQVGTTISTQRREGDRDEGRREERRDGDREEGRRETDRSDAKGGDAKGGEAPRENAATAPNNPGTRVTQAAPNTGVTPAAGQPRTALRPAMGGGLNWVAIHQEISDEGLSACKKELSKYEDNEFDKAFLGGQMAGHMKAAAELKVFRRHVSSQLASEIDSALSTTEEHLKELRDLMEDKKDQGNK
jgi:predicted outer membrane protein